MPDSVRISDREFLTAAINWRLLGQGLAAGFGCRRAARCIVARYRRGSDMLRLVKAAAPRLDHGQARLVETWLIDTAYACVNIGITIEVLLGRQRSWSQAAPTGGTDPAEQQQHRVDPVFAGRLPLTALTKDLAEVQGLVIVAADAAASYDGLYDSVRSKIWLQPSLGPLLLHAVLAHELGHALDPELVARTAWQREEFADRLALLLLEHEPKSVAEAAPLIEQAGCGLPMRLDVEGLPAPGWPSVLHFLERFDGAQELDGAGVATEAAGALAAMA